MDKHFFVVSVDYDGGMGYDDIVKTDTEVADKIMDNIETFYAESTNDKGCTITIQEYNLTDELANEILDEDDFFAHYEWADDDFPDGVKGYKREVRLTKP